MVDQLVDDRVRSLDKVRPLDVVIEAVKRDWIRIRELRQPVVDDAVCRILLREAVVAVIVFRLQFAFLFLVQQNFVAE